MCLLGIVFRQFTEMPVMVLANREEFYARPTAGPQLFPREGAVPAWMGGTDLLAGGTWLGVNEFGLLVAVTNRRKQVVPVNPPSRGLLCRSLLAFRDTASAAASADRELRDTDYAGCNLLIADRENALVIEAANDLKMTRLDAGLHLVANGAFDAAHDPRIVRVRGEFERVRGAGVEEWFQEARRICPLTAAGSQPAICLVGSDRGTVSSTVLGIARDPQNSRFWYAPGPPNTTPYDDYTPLFRELLSGRQAFQPDIEPPVNSPARRAVRRGLTYGIKVRDASAPTAASGRGAPPAADSNSPYRILLRGPWQAEPLARAERDCDGSVIWTTADLPAASTIRLPASWQDLFGTFRGRVRFRRRFHPPSNIEPGDRLIVAFNGLVGTGPVSLNGGVLGRLDPAAGNTSFDVTGLLQINNEIVVDLEFVAFGADASPGGLVAPVALEIHES